MSRHRVESVEVRELADTGGGPSGKEPIRDMGWIFPGLGKSLGGGHGNPLQYSCLKSSHGQRSLAAYSLEGHEESDRTKEA